MSTAAYVMCLVARHLDVALTSLKPELLELGAPQPIDAGESAVLVAYGYGGVTLGEAVLFGVRESTPQHPNDVGLVVLEAVAPAWRQAA